MINASARNELNVLQRVLHPLLAFLAELPLLAVTGEPGDTIVYFKEAAGDNFPAMHHVFMSKYEDVVQMISNHNQTRGFYVGGNTMMEMCFNRRTLIFLSDGEERERLKSFIRRAVHFHVPAGSTPDLIFPASPPPRNASLSEIQPFVVRNLLARMFGEPPTEEQIQHISEYYTAGLTCVFGEGFNGVFFNRLVSRVEEVRAFTVDYVKQTPVGRKMVDMASEEGIDDRELQDIFQITADGTLFAGLFGGYNLVRHSLERLRSAPELYLPMWEKDPLSFMKECVRVKTAVAGVTNVLTKDTAMVVAGQHRTLPKGTRVVGLLVGANQDPDIWGGALKSQRRAKEFDPTRPNLDMMVSWAGVEGSIKRMPRACMAHDLSLDLAAKIIDYFKPVLPPRVPKANDAPVVHHEALAFESLENLGLLSWVLVAGVALIWIRMSPHGYGPVSTNYAHYLMASMAGAFATFLHLPNALTQARLQAALALYLVLLQLRDVRNYKADSIVSLGLRIMVVGTWALIAGLVLVINHFFGADYLAYNVIVIVYTAPAILLLNYVHMRYQWYYGFNEVLFLAYIGGIALFASLFIPPQAAGMHLIVGLARIVFFLPFSLRAVLRIDDLVMDYCHGIGKGRAVMTKAQKRLKKRSRQLLLAFTAVALSLIAYQFVHGLRHGELCKGMNRVNMTPEEIALCDEKHGPLAYADQHTNTMLGILKRTFVANRSGPPVTAAQVKIPREKKPLPRKHVVSTVSVPTEDEDFIDDSVPGKLARLVRESIDELLRSDVLHPLVDNAHAWDDTVAARRFIRAAVGSDLAAPLANWTEMASDFTLSRWAFGALAAHRLQRVPDWKEKGLDHEFFVDMTWMAPLETREGFERYGATAFFNEDRNLVKIFWSHANRTVLPGDPDWEHAKWAWKGSVLTGVTLADHLVGVHLLRANVVATAVAEHLSADHPIRRFIKPYTYGTHQVNMGAVGYLCSRNGVLHRAVALTWDGVKQALAYGVQTAHYQRFEHVLHAANTHPDIIGEHRYPWGADLLRFEAVVRKMVTSYFRIYYPTEEALRADQEMIELAETLSAAAGHWLVLDTVTDVIDALTSYIVGVTGMHAHLGTVSEYLLDPTFASAKLRPGREIADVQASFQAVNIALLAGFKVPALMDDFSHLLLKDEHYTATATILAEFQRELRALSVDVDARNTERAISCNAFNPRVMHSSVSV